MSEAAEVWDERTGGTRVKRGRRLARNRPPPSPVPEGHDPSRECVMKIVSFGKSARAGAATMSYIAEGSEHVEPGTELRDAYGERFTPEEAAAYFDLVPDEENLSPAARALPEHLRSKLPEAERLRLRQTCHIVLSFPKADKVDPDTAHLIAQDFIAPWADNGYRAVYVPHLRQGRGKVDGPDHIHVVLAMASKDPGQPRLAMRKEDLQRMREHFREVAARYGVGMTATRRIDRKALQPDLVAGKAPIRKPDAFEPKRRDRLPRPQLLERQAPRWYSRHGAAWQASRAPEAVPAHVDLLPPAADLPALPPRAETGLQAWIEGRFTPEAQPLARARFLEMLAEAPRTAMWYANNRPEVFGQVAPAPGLPRLTGRAVPLSKTWRDQAMDGIRAARTRTEADDRTYRLTFADTLKPKGDAAVQARSGAFASQWLGDRYPAAEQASQLDGHLHLRHVPAWVERHADRLAGGPAPEPVVLPELPKRADKVLDTWIRAHYGAGDRPAARAAFLEMYAERPQAAIAMAAEQPAVFSPHRPRRAAAGPPADLHLDADWRAAARQAMAAAQPTPDPEDATDRQRGLAAFHDLVRNDTVVSDVALAERMRAVAETDLEAVDLVARVLADPDIVTVDDEGGRLALSSRAVVQAEARLNVTAAALAASTEGAIRPKAAAREVERFITAFRARTGHHLTDQQRAAVVAVTTGPRLTVLTGAAGAGKSTSFEAAQAVWTKAGLRVIGAAPTGIAAQALSETGIEASTLYRLRARLALEDASDALRREGQILEPLRRTLVDAAAFAADRAGTDQRRAGWSARAERIAAASTIRDLDRDTRTWIRGHADRHLKDAIDRKTVVVLDEAGMVGHEDLDDVLHRLHGRGARVVLSGDNEQLQPIAAGAALRVVERHAPPARLFEVRRQAAAWQRQASAALSSGDALQAGKALNDYVEHGHMRTGLQGIDLTEHVERAESALGTVLSPHETKLLSHVLDYVDANRIAGRLLARGEVPDPSGEDEIGRAIQRRTNAARAIGEDVERHRPWLARFGVDGERLAFRILKAQGVDRQMRADAAEALIATHRLDDLQADVTLKLDASHGARVALLNTHRNLLQSAGHGGRILILAYTNEDVARLNAGARASMRALGRLQGRDRSVANDDGSARLAKGDRIVFTANLYDGEPRQLLAANGSLATVEAIGPAKDGSPLDLVLDSGERLTVTQAFGSWRHGYAVTVHKSQGATVDHTLILDHARFDRHLATVAMTRHRQDVQVFASLSTAVDPEELVERWMLANSKTIVADTADPALVLQSQGDPAERAEQFLDTGHERLFQPPADPVDQAIAAQEAAPEVEAADATAPVPAIEAPAIETQAIAAAAGGALVNEATPSETPAADSPDVAEPAPEDPDRLAAMAAFDEIVREHTVIEDTRLANELVDRGGSVETARAWLGHIVASPEILTVMRDEETGANWFTTAAVTRQEVAIADTAAVMLQDRRGALDAPAAAAGLARFNADFSARTGFNLTHDQQQAVLQVTTGARLAYLTGPAGAGKSTAFEAARFLWEEDGLRVQGAAPTGIAAQALSATGMSASTLHGLQLRLDQQAAMRHLKSTGEILPQARDTLVHAATFIAEEADSFSRRQSWLDRAEALQSATNLQGLDQRTADWARRLADRRLTHAVGRDSVVVIDEAGMVGHEALDKALRSLDAVGARVVLSGDPEQLQPIPAGAALRAVQIQLDPAQLTAVRRQRALWQREASRLLSTGEDGDALKAFAAYGEKGHFRTDLEGYSLDEHVAAAEAALGEPISLEDRERIDTVLTYIAKRQIAGRAYAEGAAGDLALKQRMYGAVSARSVAALRIAADMPGFRPWLDRFGVDGASLARNVALAQRVPKRDRTEVAADFVHTHRLDKAEPDVELRADTAFGARSELLTDYRDALRDRPDQLRLILAYTNADVARLNAGAREAMRDLGRLTGQDREVETDNGPVSLAAGDRVIFTSNLYGDEPRALLAANGSLATVIAIQEGTDKPGVTVALDSGGTLRIDPTFGAWAHGYATTVHKSQGATVDEAFVLDHARFEKHLATVGLTRHRDDVRVYSASVHAITPGGLANRWSSPNTKANVADFADPRQVLAEELDLDARVSEYESEATMARLFPDLEDPLADLAQLDPKDRAVRVFGDLLRRQPVTDARTLADELSRRAGSRESAITLFDELMRSPDTISVNPDAPPDDQKFTARQVLDHSTRLDAVANSGGFSTGHEGYDAEAHIAEAEAALGHPLDAEDRVRALTVLDFAAHRQVAGRAFAEGIGNDDIKARMSAAIADRNAAALQIGQDIDAHKPWIDRYGVDGPDLAYRIAEARGVAKDDRPAAARELVEAHGLDKPAPDVELKIDTLHGARQALLQDYRAALETQPDRSHLILAYTNDDAAMLNAAARDAMRSAGRLSGVDTILAGDDGETPLAPGDRVLLTASLKGAPDGADPPRPGSLATITAIAEEGEGHRVGLRFDSGQEIDMPAGFVGWKHGYATTLHRAEGQLADRVYILDHRRIERSDATEALTHHRKDAHVYAAAVNAVGGKGLRDRWTGVISGDALPAEMVPEKLLASQPEPEARAEAMRAAEVQDRLFPAPVGAPEAVRPELPAQAAGPVAPAPEAKTAPEAAEPTQPKDTPEIVEAGAQQTPPRAETRRPDPVPDYTAEISALREAAGRIAARREAVQLRQQLRDGIQEAETALRTLDRRRDAAQDLETRIQQWLPQVYRDPNAAGAAIRDRIEREGLTATVRAMHTKPESFGRLRGRGGLLKDEARSRARGTAGEIGSSLPAAEEARRRVAGDAGERQAREAAIAAARARLQGLELPDVPNAQQLRAMLKALPPAQRRQLLHAERRELAQHLRAERVGQRSGRVEPGRGRDQDRGHDIER